MRKFRFKLQAVLNLRKNREEELLRALGAAQRAYQAELARKAALVADLQAALARRESLGNEPIGVLAFQLEDEFIEGTKIRILKADRDILRASKSVEKALRAYLGARRQTRAMELLREKHHVEFRREQAKREQKQLDDLTVMRQRLKEEVL